MDNHRNSQVVVAYDFSASGREALVRAVALAVRAPFHVLHFVCAIDPHGTIPNVPANGTSGYLYAERVQDAISAAVADELGHSSASDRIHFYAHARFGAPADEIMAVAREVGADLIILGTHGRTGIEHVLLGSVAEKVVREAACSVEIARPMRYEHVQLLDVHEVAPNAHYVKPHRYSYENRQVQMRPSEWPLY